MNALIMCLSIAVAALSGAMAMYGFTRLYYRIALADIRRIDPYAVLCIFDFDTMALWLMPLGAACMILVGDLLSRVYDERQSTPATERSEHGIE